MAIFEVVHITTRKAPAAQTYAHPTSVAMINAAIAAGPTNLVLLIAIELSDIALIMSFLSTRFGMIDVRTGWFIAMPAPRPNART